MPKPIVDADSGVIGLGPILFLSLHADLISAFKVLKRLLRTAPIKRYRRA